MNFVTYFCIGSMAVSLFVCAKYIMKMSDTLHDMITEIVDLTAEIASLRRALKEKKD